VLTGRVTLSGRRLLLPLACAAYDVARCAGRLWVESASWRTATLINGRPSGRLIRPVTRRLTLPAATAAPVTLRLGRRPSPRASLRLRVTLREDQGSSELVVGAVRLR
jgi:hypothetical protein